MTHVFTIVPPAPRPAFNAQSLSRRPQSPYSALTYTVLIKTAEDVLLDAQADKTLMRDIFEPLVERHAAHPHFGYDATRLLSQTWDNASPDIALDVMGNLTLLTNPKLLNSFYATIADKMADLLEKGGHTDVIGQLNILKSMAARRGHSQWHKSMSKAYIDIFTQIMGDKEFLLPSIGMLPEVLRTKAGIASPYDDASFNFIVNFLDEHKAGLSGLIFSAIYDIFVSKTKLKPEHKDKLIDFAIRLYQGAPAFQEDPTLGVYQACQFFSNFIGGSRKWRQKGIAGINMALANLANLHGLELRKKFSRAYASDVDLCPDIHRLLKKDLMRSGAQPKP